MPDGLELEELGRVPEAPACTAACDPLDVLGGERLELQVAPLIARIFGLSSNWSYSARVTMLRANDRQASTAELKVSRA